jgi:hypothetical protein
MSLRRQVIAPSIVLAALLSTNAAHAVVIDTTSGALYAFDVAGTGPFPSIDLLLSFPDPSSGPPEELEFESPDALTFSIYDQLDQPPLFSFGPFSPSGAADLVGFKITGLITPFADSEGFVFVGATAGSFDLTSLIVRLGTSSDFFNPAFGDPVTAELIDTELPNQVPEPMTLVLFGVGLAAFAAMRWRGKLQAPLTRL